MTAPIVAPICISAVTTLTGIFTEITKKVSSCSQRKLRDYTLKLTTAPNAHSELSVLISSAINDKEISKEEFSNMAKLYNTAMGKLESSDNNNNARFSSRKYKRDSKTTDV